MATENALEEFHQLAAQVRNWGRWGAEDERGTLNHITAERLVGAARLVTEGVIVALGVSFDEYGPQPGKGRINPIRLMSETGEGQNYPGGMHWADDYVIMPLQAATQWDALGHVYYDGQLYNGFPATEITVKGLRRDSIDKVAKGITGRGVLLDVARWRGVDWLESGTVVTPDDLDAVALAQGTQVEPGDILLVRTGWWAKFVRDASAIGYMAGEPGLGMRCAAWLHEKEVAAICADNFSVEVLSPATEGGYVGEHAGLLLPLHMLLLRDMGMMIGEIFDLEELGATCAELQRYEFLFCAPPLKFTGGAGSPINPLALF